jgi:F-type H+-transporting ATPase subunit c
VRASGRNRHGKGNRSRGRIHRRRPPARRGAIGAAIGDGLAGSATINGVARQPEAQTRLFTIFFTTVGLCEAMYFINLAFMALFVFVFGKSV